MSGFVKWGGGQGWVSAPMPLGMGSHRNHPPFGLRSIAWNAAMGYVSGFPVRDIAWFCLTRCVSPRIQHWAIMRQDDSRGRATCGVGTNRKTNAPVVCPVCAKREPEQYGALIAFSRKVLARDPR